MSPHIKNALLNGRLVLLLGAGASKGCKNSLKDDPPLGWDLAKILAEEMGDEFEDGDDLSDVYAAAKRKLGSQVQSIFERHYKHCTPSNEYSELVKYPFFRIYSLNIDDGFEKAAYSINKRKFNVRKRNDNVVDPDQFYQTLDFIKLNGDVNNPSDGYIFSAQEYAKGSTNEPLWYNELARDYHRYTFIFIGTKLKEPLFSHQIEKYKAKTGSTDLKSYILIPSLSKMKKSALEASNIHHIEGTLKDLIDWLKSEFDTPPTGQDIVLNTRPELRLASSGSGGGGISLFSGVTPVSRAALALMESRSHDSEIREFYKGFKPSWFDILDEVPANLKGVKNFFTSVLQKNKPKPLELHVLFGTAGCGKTTALKQLALKLADEGGRNVYFLEEYKDNFKDLIRELDERNKSPYYLVIERIGDVAIQLSEVIKSALSDKAIFISSENPKIWNSRVKEHVEEFLTTSSDISHIAESDADLILEKLKQFGNWTRLAKMSAKNRKIEILKKSKKQLLIGLIEATSGEGYNKIIQKDYKAITCESEKALLLLTGLATTQRVPASESTLTRAMHSLDCNPNVHYVASRMDGIVAYENGKLTTRHRVYIERLFKLYVSQEDILSAIHAYIEAFSVYKFPIVKNISRNESTIYKHLVNARYLKRVLNNNEEKVLSVYKRFEKTFEHEGLFLMQYGLALRSFDKNEDAFEKLRVAFEAFPESPHIEHALAQQRIILACRTHDEVISMAHFSEAESVLNRLHSSNINAFDRYPIITLAEGHVKVMEHLSYISEAKVLAKQYHDQIRRLKNSHTSSRLDQAASSLAKFYIDGRWPEVPNEDSAI
ncbi:cold-shock protein [Halomonas campisalis]|uniref:Cold-shock protein n=1 Tax=Billgrantia campisalis TaxID=74661 RepID=A0ABS9PCD7_9GAMM|nr:SIR2 family protein [Halomonas campisalis]MCG6658755.1 cold-shock protein [Halomonas campisalis]MDR5864863.1 SIR2 family protein [Halomonas campisalis]